jgi:hypothetical protein
MGIGWFLVVKLCKDFDDKKNSFLHKTQLDYENTDNFMTYYELETNTEFQNLIIGMYFAYTTLSTVGFGDFAPRSDNERLLTALILMIGVSVFSVFLGNLTEIIDQYKAINEELEDFNALDSFFETIKHFNDGCPLAMSVQL